MSTPLADPLRELLRATGLGDQIAFAELYRVAVGLRPYLKISFLQCFAGSVGCSLALGEVVHGAKPSTQRHFGRGENRSGDQGCLPSTGSALVKRSGLDQAVMLAPADWADEAQWPAPAHHRLSALILCSVNNSKLSLTEALLKLDLVARHRSNPQKQSHVPGLYHIVLAEDSR